MRANTALTFTLSGISLWLSRAESPEGWRRRLARICGSIVALVGLITLSEYLFAWDPGIDRLLGGDLHAPAGPYHTPGRMAFATALNFFLLGGALLLLDVKTRRGYQPAEHVAIAVAMSASLTLVVYLYSDAAVHQTYPFVTVAPHTTLLFIVLSVGVLFARPQHTVMGIMTSDTVAAAAIRRLLLVAILLPGSIGWVRLTAQRFGLFGTEFGLALMVTFAIVGLTGSIYWQAKSLIQAEVYQREINEMSMVLSRTIVLEDALPFVVAAVKKIVLCDRICVVVREGERLVATLSFADPPLQCFHGKTWRPSGETAVEWVMTHKIPHLVRDLTLEQRFADELIVAREGIRSILILPLLVGGQVVGSVTLDSRTPGTYTQEHVTLLSGFMEPLASAIRNAELHAEVVRYANELERLVEVRTQELQVANGHLEEASRHKSNFLANMSHELRTPLNAILGFTGLLRDQTGGPLTAKQARYADHIHTSGTHLLALINDLLDLSKVEAGKLTLRIEPFALSEALAAAVRDIQPSADLKRLTLALDVDTAPPTLTADPVRFKQIIFNLLSNAVKFTPDGGRITVTARIVPGVGHREAGSRRQAPGSQDGELLDSGDCVEIAVTDTGIGIEAEDLPTLFERFRQLETTKRSQGSGLGLALTKQLVELHGGTMTAASAGSGQGSSFTVCLPLTPPAVQEQ